MISVTALTRKYNRRYVRQSFVPIVYAHSWEGRQGLALRRAHKRKAAQAKAAQQALEDAQASSGRVARQLATLRRSLRQRGV